MIRLIARICKKDTLPAATLGLAALLLCAGCIGPFRPSKTCESCSEEVNESVGCEESPNCNCVQPSCCHEGFACRMSRKCLHIVCLPCRACQCTVNFCARNENVGPPDVQSPGRFQPVPTHPVFAPSSEP